MNLLSALLLGLAWASWFIHTGIRRELERQGVQFNTGMDIAYWGGLAVLATGTAVLIVVVVVP